MQRMIDSFWRAALYCLQPRVMVLSLLPLLLMVVLAWVLGYYWWDAALAQVNAWLQAFVLGQWFWQWLENVGAQGLQSVLAPLIVIFLTTPVLVILTLMLVSVFMTPTLTRWVAQRRFPQLERKQGASFLQSVLWGLGSTALAVLAMVLSLPLWLVPPLALVLPALIWGWLTYRVMAFDALADFASQEERHELMARHRLNFLAMGIFSGMLGAAPGVVWASGALFAAAFVVLVPVAIWIYALVLSFSALWFAHYALSALAQLRLESAQAQARGGDGPHALPHPPAAQQTSHPRA